MPSQPSSSRGIVVPLMERDTLCLASLEPGVATHSGECGYPENVKRWFDVPENNAMEKLVKLKAELKRADAETFWKMLMEGMTTICNAQYGFVAKRILVDDHDTAVEMPPIGELGSCLLGVAFYFNDGEENVGMLRDYKYLAWGAPCAHMRHDKVFLIPERLNEFITSNPNKFPFPTEAYLGVPLFSEGKCFAHFGMMWDAAGLEKRDLGWGCLEMVLHALEDLILDRLLRGESFAKAGEKNQNPKVPTVIPQEAITASQSLKPYARSLSHELRTPMQGVVGMLDVMHATVQEAVEGQTNPKIRSIFQALRENIEVVQDSSRRAVEAADNVVHAYDLNMQVPDTPQDHMDEGSPDMVSSTSVFENRPNILIEGSNIPVNPYKRRRSSPVDWNYGPAPKHRALQPSPRRDFTEIQLSPRSEDLKTVVEESEQIMRASPEEGLEETANGVNQPRVQRRSSTRGSAADEGMASAGVRNTQLRDLIHLVINESLRVGGRPDSAIAEETQYGEKIEVRSRSSNGQSSMKTIQWSVDPSVPETILIDERDLTKLISVVFLNAIKFTESGKITVDATLSPRSRYVVINVIDEGDGIKESFLPRLFGAFSRENDSTTRPKEGLGLGLMVAKGIARRLGGDLNLVRTSTSGPDKGSEFEIKVPKTPSDAASHPSTPYRSPTPSRPSSYFSGIDAPTTNPSPGRHKSHSHPQPQTPRRESLHPSSARERDSPTPDRNTKPPTPLHPSSPSRHNSSRSSKDKDPPPNSARRHSSIKKAGPPSDSYDRNLAKKHPLTILVAEDNRLNRKLLVAMLGKLGYKDILEAFDGGEAVRLMKENLSASRPAKKGKSKSPPPTKPVDVVLMDLWMPEMDGYEAAERILDMFDKREGPVHHPGPTVLAITADVTDEAISRAHKVGMEGYMTKPYTLMDLERLIVEFCGRRDGQDRGRQR